MGWRQKDMSLKWRAIYDADPPFDVTLAYAHEWYVGTEQEFIAELRRLLVVLESSHEGS